MLLAMHARTTLPQHRRIQIFIASFMAVTSIHTIRTTYSFSKSYIPSQIEIQAQQIGIVDSIMLLFVGVGNLVIAVRPLANPLRALAIAFVLCGLEYALVPVSMSLLHGQSAFATLLLLMAVNGYLQSFSWPNLLPLIHSVYCPDDNAILLSFWTAGTNVGNILGFVVCQYLGLGLGLGWQFGVYAAALYIVAIGLYVGVRIREMPLLEGKAQSKQSVKSEVQSGKQNEGMRQSLLSQSSAISEHSAPASDPQQQPSVLQVLLHSPRVALLTLSFALLKSVMYGILLWLPAYFYSIGLVQYSLYIPMTFDGAAIVGSVLLGLVLRTLPPNRKNLAIIPMLCLLLVFFVALKAVDFSVTGYFIVIGLVGLCLGGSFNSMAGLVTMQLVRALPPQKQTRYLSFYSALLMAFANLITSITQVIISYTVGTKDEGSLFGIFVVYTAINLVCLIGVALVEEYTLRGAKGTVGVLEGYQPDKPIHQIEITHLK